MAHLERLGLVDKLKPVTSPSTGKKTAYTISDQFLRFHYRFLDPATSQLRTSRLAAAYVHETVLPQLDHHASPAWEEICREYILHTAEGVSTGAEDRYLFSRNGFSERLRAYAANDERCHLVTPDDIYERFA